MLSVKFGQRGNVRTELCVLEVVPVIKKLLDRLLSVKRSSKARTGCQVIRGRETPLATFKVFLASPGEIERVPMHLATAVMPVAMERGHNPCEAHGLRTGTKGAVCHGPRESARDVVTH